MKIRKKWSITTNCKCIVCNNNLKISKWYSAQQFAKKCSKRQFAVIEENNPEKEKRVRKDNFKKEEQCDHEIKKKIIKNIKVEFAFLTFSITSETSTFILIVKS